MSSTLFHDADALQPIGRCEPGFAKALVASDAACALIDPTGAVMDASGVLRTLVPNLIGRNVREVFHIDPSVLHSPLRAARSADGVYCDADGEPMPAIVKTLYEVDDLNATLVLVSDGSRFRRAETARFESTPYTVMRVSPDGIIRFANPMSFKVLPHESRGIVGRSLSSFFLLCDRQPIADKLEQCLSGLTSQTLRVTIEASKDCPEQLIQLIMTPDRAPSQDPLGALVVIESTMLERVREEIARLALDPGVKNWRRRIELILRRIHQLIDFEHATFGIYAEKMSLFRAVAIYPEGSIKWPARWMDISPAVANWVDEGETWVEDIEKFIDKDATLRESEVAQCYVDDGIRSSVTLVVRNTKGPTSALTLCSKKLAMYGKAHLDILRELDLEPVLLRCEEDRRRERIHLGERMQKLLATTSDLPEAARTIVGEIRDHFEWDYAGLFRVDRYRNQFQLFHQSVSKDEYRIKDDTNYVQHIEAGMLAASLRNNEIRVINEIGAKDIEQFGYVGPNREMNSAMTLPVRLNGRIRWILGVESAASHAFRGPDKKLLQEVVGLIEEGLTHRMMAEIKECLLHESEQGVIVVGTEGTILEMNLIAASMLGLANKRIDDKPIFLSKFGYNDHAKAVLDGAVRTVRRRIELVSENGQRHLVLASRQDLETSFDTALWFLTDLESLAWSRDLRFLRETVAEVAQQSRAPLSLASSLARQIPKFWSETADDGGDLRWRKTQDACRRLVAEISKADITYERLAEGLAIRKEPMRRRERLFLRRCLSGVIDALPQRDRQRIVLGEGGEQIAVTGDEGRLAFVVRSIVAHLLRTRLDDDTQVIVELKLNDPDGLGNRNAAVWLGLGLATPMSFPGAPRAGRRDALWAAYQAARDDANLSLDVIRSVVMAHSGTLTTEPPDEGERDAAYPYMSFTITIPEDLTERRGAP